MDEGHVLRIEVVSLTCVFALGCAGAHRPFLPWGLKPAEPGSAGPKSTTPRLIVKIKMPTDPSKASPASTSGGAQPSPSPSPAPADPGGKKEEPAIWRRPERFQSSDSSSSSDSGSDDGEDGGGGGGGAGAGGKHEPLNPPPKPRQQEEQWQPNRPPAQRPTPPPPKKRSLPSPSPLGGNKAKKSKASPIGGGGGGAAAAGMVPLASLPPGSIAAFGRPVYDQEVVWGKLGSFPWWPCQVNLEPNEAGRRAKHGPTDTFVAFYGTGDVAWLPMDKIKPFSHEYSKKAGVKNKALQKAVAEARSHILASGGDLPAS